MILASLIDLGFPVSYLEEQLAKLQIEKITIGIQKVVRNGITCTYITPEWQQAMNYRHLGEILHILRQGKFSEKVYTRCETVLNTLAEAEARVHGIPKDHVHFHEIGAVDTIIDILGVSLALEYLGIDAIQFSTITEGHGSIESEHGVIPVPVPATSVMIQGYDIKILDIPTELLTPTGAAILTSLGKQVSGGIQGTVGKIGYGCGTKVFKNHPNLIRSWIVEQKVDDGSERDFVWVLETDSDHISGEIMGHTAQVLMEQGALDVSYIPIYMKKGRPGYRLSVISSEGDCGKMIDLIMVNTRTLGVRLQHIERVIARRECCEIKFLDNTVGEKRCTYKGYSFSKLEYDSLNSVSKSTGIPIIELMERYIQEKVNE
jgi:uncharacterized protein (TIGR00299 family) protein